MSASTTSTSGKDFAVAISRICGWLYFLAWSTSFYPQFLLNIRRRSTSGFIPDFPVLNILGFTCYTLSATLFLYSPTIRSQYAVRHPASPDPTVRFNDFVFGLHAWVLCILTFSQFWPRLWGWKEVERGTGREVTRVTAGLFVGSVCAVVICCVVVLCTPSHGMDGRGWAWIDVIYSLSYIKVLLTLFKYLPQAFANYHRKSTLGWAIDGILLDVTGGVLSMVQLVIDSALQDDWSGLTGNPMKFGLANISLAMDAVFMTQHYVLYGPVEEADKDERGGDVEEDTAPRNDARARERDSLLPTSRRDSSEIF